MSICLGQGVPECDSCMVAMSKRLRLHTRAGILDTPFFPMKICCVDEGSGGMSLWPSCLWRRSDHLPPTFQSHRRVRQPSSSSAPFPGSSPFQHLLWYYPGLWYFREGAFWVPTHDGSCEAGHLLKDAPQLSIFSSYQGEFRYQSHMTPPPPRPG